MADVNQPVRPIDPTTSYYGNLKTTNAPIQKVVDRQFNDKDAGGAPLNNEKGAKLDAMKRRMGKV